MRKNIIKKTYEYEIPLPHDLFKSFQQEVDNSDLPLEWNANREWTNYIYGIFEKMGIQYGYSPRREYLRLDQTWEIRHDDLSSIILSLEIENTSEISDLIDDELRKLMDIKSYLKVILFYPQIPVTEIDGEFLYPEIIQKIQSSKIKIKEEVYIFISIVNASEEKELEISGCSISSFGKIETLGYFQVNYPPGSTA